MCWKEGRRKQVRCQLLTIDKRLSTESNDWVTSVRIRPCKWSKPFSFFFLVQSWDRVVCRHFTEETLRSSCQMITGNPHNEKLKEAQYILNKKLTSRKESMVPRSRVSYKQIRAIRVFLCNCGLKEKWALVCACVCVCTCVFFVGVYLNGDGLVGN